MKKEELLEIGLTDEQADKVFALNGKDVEKYKSQAAEAKKDVTDLRDQLTQRDKDIEDLKKNAGDADDLKTKLDTLQKKYDTDTAEFQSKLDARDYADAVRAGITAKGIKFTSKAAEKAFIADLTANKLEMKDGTLTGFDDYCKKQQESDPAAFQSEKPAPTFANPIQSLVWRADLPARFPQRPVVARRSGRSRNHEAWRGRSRRAAG